MKDATRMIWLAVAENGRCTSADIREHIPSMPARVVNNRLNNMLSAGMLKRFPDGTVGVTNDCVFPQSMPVRDALHAMGMSA